MIDTSKFFAAVDAAGYSRSELAAKMGWTEKTLIEKVNNQMPITLQEIKRLVDILKIADADEMLGVFFNGVIFGRYAP